MRKLLILLAAVVFAVPAFADNINLVPPGTYYNWVDSYSFPAGSFYNQYYGSALLEAVTETSSLESVVEVWNGTTNGALTQFASSYVYIYNWAGNAYNEFSGSLTNAVFNSQTDVLSGRFSGYDYESNGHTVAMSGQFTETFNMNGYSGSYPGYYDYSQGSVVSGSLTTAPEPSSLLMFGTGLIAVAGVIRRKLKA